MTSRRAGASGSTSTESKTDELFRHTLQTALQEAAAFRDPGDGVGLVVPLPARVALGGRHSAASLVERVPGLLPRFVLSIELGEAVPEPGNSLVASCRGAAQSIPALSEALHLCVVLGAAPVDQSEGFSVSGDSGLERLEFLERGALPIPGAIERPALPLRRSIRPVRNLFRLSRRPRRRLPAPRDRHRRPERATCPSPTPRRLPESPP